MGGFVTSALPVKPPRLSLFFRLRASAAPLFFSFVSAADYCTKSARARTKCTYIAHIQTCSETHGKEGGLCFALAVCACALWVGCGSPHIIHISVYMFRYIYIYIIYLWAILVAPPDLRLLQDKTGFTVIIVLYLSW